MAFIHEDEAGDAQRRQRLDAELQADLAAFNKPPDPGMPPSDLDAEEHGHEKGNRGFIPIPKKETKSLRGGSVLVAGKLIDRRQ